MLTLLFKSSRGLESQKPVLAILKPQPWILRRSAAATYHKARRHERPCWTDSCLQRPPAQSIHRKYRCECWRVMMTTSGRRFAPWHRVKMVGLLYLVNEDSLEVLIQRPVPHFWWETVSPISVRTITILPLLTIKNKHLEVSELHYFSSLYGVT